MAVALACATSAFSNRQPRAAFGNEYAHDGLYAMAAAYLFHSASNHPFVDGNKRTALLAALVVLDLNGLSIDHSSELLYDLTTGIAEGCIDKPQAVRELERIATGGEPVKREGR